MLSHCYWLLRDLCINRNSLFYEHVPNSFTDKAFPCYRIIFIFVNSKRKFPTIASVGCNPSSCPALQTAGIVALGFSYLGRRKHDRFSAGFESCFCRIIPNGVARGTVSKPEERMITLLSFSLDIFFKSPNFAWFWCIFMCKFKPTSESHNSTASDFMFHLSICVSFSEHHLKLLWKNWEDLKR